MTARHGGSRQPRNPAAVSNPQSGARTDGGAGSSKQPLRVPTGGGYGEAGRLTEQQQGAPLAAGGGGGAGTQGGSPVSGAMDGPGAVGGAPQGAFGPTTRPDEPLTAGTMTTADEIPDAKAVLQAIYDVYPSPWIGALLYGG